MSQFEARKRLEILYTAGVGNRMELAAATGLTPRSVNRIMNRIQSGIPMEHQKGAGRIPLATVNDRRRLVQIALKNPTKPASFIRRRSVELGGPVLSVRTVQRYLSDSDIKKLVPKPALNLSAAHKMARVDFCDQFLHHDFTKTFFTDESSFSFSRLSCPQWSAQKPRRIPTPKFPKTIMVWGGISLMGPTNISIVKGSIDSSKYVDILHDNLLPPAAAYYEQEWELQHDNAPPHVSAWTREWLADNVPSVLPWPANSADLNPVENLWLIMKNAVEKEQAKTFPEFQQKVVQFWDGLELRTTSRWIDLVPLRLRACRDALGNEIDVKPFL